MAGAELDAAAGNEGTVVADAVPPTKAGLAYLTYGMFAFLPGNFAAGKVITGSGAYCDKLSGFLVAPLDLPSGALLREVTFTGVNTSGTSRAFSVERFGLAGVNQGIAGLVMPSGAPAFQTVTAALNHVVDPAYSYDAVVGTITSGTVRIFSLRVGYSGPFGVIPVRPQVRKLDTRNPGPHGGRFSPGQQKTILLTPQLPAGAAAALINLTVTGTEGNGFLSVFPGGTTWPGTSSINWSAQDQTIANSVTVAVSPTGAINIFCNGFGRTHAIVDLIGYYI
jgi:hypothetical protein